MLSYWVRPRDYEGFAEFLQLGRDTERDTERDAGRDAERDAASGRPPVSLPAVMLFQSQRFDLYRFSPSGANLLRRGLAVADVTGPQGLDGWLALFWRQSIKPLFKTQEPFPAVARPLREVQHLSGDRCASLPLTPLPLKRSYRPHEVLVRNSFSAWVSNRSRDALIAVPNPANMHCASASLSLSLSLSLSICLPPPPLLPVCVRAGARVCVLHMRVCVCCR